MAETQSETPDPCSCLVPTTFHLKGSRGGPLSGLSFVAKDLFAVKRHTSSFGHARWRDTHTESATTAPAVLDLLDAGADLVGMAKMDQLAYSLIGDAGEGSAPVNSANPDLYCGGSSSGSAAAVASGLADFALGSDTAGSIRIPAAVCGLVGIRPTHGSISCDGVIPLAPSFDVVGVLAASASTLRDVFTAVAPTLSHDRAPTRVQIAADLFSTVDEQTARIGSHVAQLAATLTGNQLEEIEFRSLTSPDIGGLFARLQSREIWGLHAEWVSDNAPALADDVRERLERCKQLSLDSEVVQRSDLSRRQEFRERFAEAIPPDTIVVLPVLPERGPKRDWAAPKLFDFRTRCFQLTAPAGLAGAPQVVWNARTSMGRPVGIGLLAAPGEDHLLLAMLNRLNDDPTVTLPVRTHSMQPPQP